MLTRPPNVPPRTSFQIPSAISCGLLRGGAIVPAKIKDCAAPGLSIKYTSACFGAATFEMLFFGVFPCFQDAKAFSSCGLISAGVVSPTITSVVLFGRYHVSWNLAIASRVSLPTPASVNSSP